MILYPRLTTRLGMVTGVVAEVNATLHSYLGSASPYSMPTLPFPNGIAIRYI